MLNSLETALSAERLATYLALTSGDRKHSILLYLWNAELSESLQFPVHILEVSVRNAIHRELSRAYGSNWYAHSRCSLKPPLTNIIRRVTDNLTTEGKPITPPHVVASLTMGFWIYLLSKHYETLLWRSYLIKAFPFAPRPFERSKARVALNNIRIIRNRIAHHEPILSKHPQQIYNLILETTSWISPDTANWVGHHCRFDQVWADRPPIKFQ